MGSQGSKRRVVFSSTAEETRALGAALGRVLGPGALVLVSGELGTGKTTLVQGIARGMGIGEPVTSPSFVLVREYTVGSRRLVHMDFYRLTSPAEVVELGLEDYLAAEGVVAIEWPEHAGDRLPAQALRIELAYEGDGRRIVISARGSEAEHVLAELVVPPMEVR